MNEKSAAIKIQSWYRRCIAQKLFVSDVRKQFEEIAEEIGDKKPKWNSSFFCLPDFEMSREVERDFVESNIAHRLAVLKYQSEIET